MKGAAILYHKHPASARTQFVKYSHDSVVGPEKLPSLTSMVEEAEESGEQQAQDVIDSILDYFNLDESQICIDEEFSGAVETPSSTFPVYLLSIKMMDPPFEKMAAKGANFIALTEARGLSDYDLLLLQKAYKAIMEG